MAWGSSDTSTQLTSITTEQSFDDLIQLGPGESAHCQVEVNFPSSPTDHAIVSVYSTLDASSEVWDLVPFLSILLDKGTDPNRVSFIVSGVYKFKVAVKRSGSTDTLTSADMKYRKNGIAL